MSFSVFTKSGSRAGRTYTTVELAEQDCADRNAKAEAMGADVRYEMRPYELNPEVDGRETVRNVYKAI